MRTLLLTSFLSLVASSPALARFQDEEPGPRDYWIDVFYPKLLYSSRDGGALGGHVALIQPVRFEDFLTEAASYRASVALNVLATTKGSRHAHLTFAAPAYVDGWRFTAQVGAWRAARDPYHGIGNDAPFDDDLVTEAAPHFYEAVRTWYRARGEAQRRIAGGLRFLMGLHLERRTLDTLDGPSVLANDRLAGFDPTIGAFVTDVAARVGLVFDTRDDEVAPKRGALLEFIVGVADDGVLGNLSYARTTVSARAYATPTPRLTLAGRVVAQGMSGTPGVGSYYLVEESDRTYTGIGGGLSHRGIRDNRLLGRHKLLGNAEARFEIVGLPTLYSVTALAFLDAGRVFEDEDFRLTLSGMAVGGGGGFVFQLGRRGVLGFTTGVGPDGLVTNLVTKWPF